MATLTSLKNIGETSAGWLESVGIKTAEDLYELGVVEAYRRVKTAYPERVTLNMLYALQGALLDLHWKEVPPEMKTTLLQQVGEEVTRRRRPAKGRRSW
ncbi:MAG: TfoX/Sxy family protein [Chloroflexota bacterium]